MNSNHKEEISSGKRFEFGRNWSNYLSLVDNERIANSERCLCDFLQLKSLEGLSFVDVGCGSGLSSLAARRLGARVYSFDYDPESVACTNQLRSRFFPDDPDWVVESGSVLDDDYVAGLGTFDVVYSWGVLHHTGDMWKAFKNVSRLNGRSGFLFVAIYNYQPYWSRFYYLLKKCYVKSPGPMKFFIASTYILSQVLTAGLRDLVFLKNPFKRYSDKIRDRGMSKFYDWIDWVGGYPFEVARPEEVLDFFLPMSYRLVKLKTMGGGLGCNEFLFRKDGEGSKSSK